MCLRDTICDCMSARNKNKFGKVQGLAGFSLLLLLWAGQYLQITFLESCMFSLFLSMLIVKVHRWVYLGIFYMSSSAFESYCTFNCSGFNYREKVHLTAGSSASSVNLLRMRYGLMLVWGEIREESTIHVTGQSCDHPVQLWVGRGTSRRELQGYWWQGLLELKQ